MRAMPVVGVGVDIVEVERIRKALHRHGERFLDRVFSSEEKARCGERRDPAPCLAACFAAKEAASKALGTGMEGLSWKELVVLTGKGGQPIMELRGTALARAGEMGVERILVSVSHSRGYAVAVAFALADKPSGEAVRAAEEGPGYGG